MTCISNGGWTVLGAFRRFRGCNGIFCVILIGCLIEPVCIIVNCNWWLIWSCCSTLYLKSWLSIVIATFMIWESLFFFFLSWFSIFFWSFNLHLPGILQQFFATVPVIPSCQYSHCWHFRLQAWRWTRLQEYTDFLIISRFCKIVDTSCSIAMKLGRNQEWSFLQARKWRYRVAYWEICTRFLHFRVPNKYGLRRDACFHLQNSAGESCMFCYACLNMGSVCKRGKC